MRVEDRPGALALLNTVNRTPSNRARPSNVPTQRYPSRVCTMARTEFCGRPESAVQASNRYSAAARSTAMTSTHARQYQYLIPLIALDVGDVFWARRIAV